jgi:Spy/CpxP family protein refolding chaperone
MNNKAQVRALCLFLVLLFVPVPVFAVNNGPGMLRERDLARVRKKVEALRAWQLTEELDLDQETSSKLFPAMKDADEARWRIEAQNRALFQEMVHLANDGKPDSGRINNILDQLQANRMEMARIEEQHMKRIRQIFSPEDAARYLMFTLRFHKELREKAARSFRETRKSWGGEADRNHSGTGGDMGK